MRSPKNPEQFAIRTARVPMSLDGTRSPYLAQSRAVTELFTMSIPETGLAETLSRRAEDAGWDGITFTDSQNLVGDPFVAMALGARATERLQFMTGVTNAATRLPAALATVAATVQEESGGRGELRVRGGGTPLVPP